jgi:hypothetical protein
MKLLRGNDVTTANLRIDPSAHRLLILKGADREPMDVDIAAADETRAMAVRLAAYNAFLAQQRLTMLCSDVELAQLRNEMREMATELQPRRWRRPTQPEYFRCRLHRVFNDERWDHGGRFYGGWWQQLPSRWRTHLGINGHPTIELDYAGFAVRAIYHQRGIDYRDDPYDLAELRALTEPVNCRSHVKALLQAMINCPAGKSLSHVRIGSPLPKRASRSKLTAWLRTKHAGIADVFNSREGLRLQHLESTIAEAIMLAGKDNNICVLPIHDSFIVPQADKEWLMQQMVGCYRERLGFDPVIGTK